MQAVLRYEIESSHLEDEYYDPLMSCDITMVFITSIQENIIFLENFGEEVNCNTDLLMPVVHERMLLKKSNLAALFGAKLSN